jgi:hypothetical protein
MVHIATFHIPINTKEEAINLLAQGRLRIIRLAGLLSHMQWRDVWTESPTGD